MRAVILVRRYLKTACASIHVTQLTVLFVAVEALIHGGRLTVTGLGRALCVALQSSMRSSGWTAS